MALAMGRGRRAAVSAVGMAAFVLAQVACSNSSQSSIGPGGGGPCNSAPPPGPTPPAGQPDSLYISGASAPACQFSCGLGLSIPITAIVTDAYGTRLTNQNVTWTTSDASIIGVVGKGLTQTGYLGLATCLTAGSATVAAVNGPLEASVSVASQ